MAPPPRLGPIRPRNAWSTVVAELTSSCAALTARTMVGRSPLSLSLPCIMPLMGSSSLRMTCFQRAYSPVMQKGALAPLRGGDGLGLAADAPVEIQPDAESSGSWGGSALTIRETTPCVQSAAPVR